MIDKESAISLRRQGMTYQQVANYMGISKAWCAKNLQDVPRGVGSEFDGTRKEIMIDLVEKLLLMLKEDV